jgi:hypothetical protein
MKHLQSETMAMRIFIRAGIDDEDSGPTKITTHFNHMSHGETASGTIG